MRVQTEEWRRFIPGVRMYKGKKTFFYNGEILWDDENHEYLVYDREEQESWEVIIVLPGVEVIPSATFDGCKNIEAVIMSDTVRRVESYGFSDCKSLVFVKLSRNLEYIGVSAFAESISLPSIIIPPSCRWIGDDAFGCCTKLIILVVPPHTQLGRGVIVGTALIEASPFATVQSHSMNIGQVNNWIKTHHADNEFPLHQACASYNPLDEVIFNIIKRQGLKAFKRPDRIGVTASQYLSENPFSEVKEQMITKRYILDMMGEVI